MNSRRKWSSSRQGFLPLAVRSGLGIHPPPTVPPMYYFLATPRDDEVVSSSKGGDADGSVTGGWNGKTNTRR